SGYAILRLHGTGQLASRLAPSVWNTLSRSRLVHSKLLCRSDWFFKAGMAELADAADSKSAGLRPLGVRLPLPAPPQVPYAEPAHRIVPGRRCYANYPVSNTLTPWSSLIEHSPL